MSGESPTGWTQADRERLAAIEKKLHRHLHSDETAQAQQAKERQDIQKQVETLSDRLFGNGTKKGSIEDRLATAERVLETLKERQWTKEDQMAFEDHLQQKMDDQTTALLGKIDSLKRRMGMPWLILSNLILCAGAVAAIIALFVHAAGSAH